MDKTKEKKIQDYYDFIYRFIFMQVNHVQEAEDIAQETFYKFLTSDISFASVEQEKAWLFKVAMNLCRNYWRSTWYKRVIPIHEESGYAEGIEVDILQREEEQMMLKAVFKLPLKYRQVIHLFYYEKMSVKEIGSLTGKKESTIQTQLARGRELLKKKIGEEWNE